MAGAYSSAYSSAFDSDAGGTVVTPAAVTAAATLPTPSVLAAVTVTPATVTITVTVPNPFVGIVTPNVVPLTVTLPTPGAGVVTAATVTPARVHVTVALPQPIPKVPIAEIAFPATVNVSVSLPRPFVGIITPATVALNTTLPTPLAIGGQANPAVIALTVSIPTPTISVLPAVTPTVIPLIVSIPTPTVEAGAKQPLTVPLIVSIPTPYVAAGGADGQIARHSVEVAVSTAVTEIAARLAREALVVPHHYPEANTDLRLGRHSVVIVISRPHGWDIMDDPGILGDLYGSSDTPPPPPPALPPPPIPPPPPPTPPTDAPAAPTGLVATAGDGQIQLGWADNTETDLASYRVYSSTSSGGPWVLLATVTVSDYTATGLSNGTTFYFRIAAVDTSNLESTWTTAASATPTDPDVGDVTPPPVPAGLSTVSGSGQIFLDWNDSTASDFANFKVFRSLSLGGSYTLVATRTVSNFTNTGLTNGVEYFYKVSAVDQTGNESAQSVIVSDIPDVAAAGVTIGVGQSIQAHVNANPSGTLFYLAAGRHLSQQVTPKPDNTFVGVVDSNGQRLTILDGNLNTEYSIYHLLPSTAISGVTIRNLIVERYNTPVQKSALGGSGLTNMLIENCEVRYNKAGGIRFGSGSTVRTSWIHHNEQIGMMADGAVNSTVENCDISFNNWLRLYDPGWEAGGSKFLNTENLHLTGNNVHDNHGPGLWTDFQNYLTVIEGNTLRNNWGPGIFHEISYDAVIRNNLCVNNGHGYTAWLDGSGILVNSSQNVEVYGNTMNANRCGIGATYTARGSGNRGAFEVRNLNVHNNTITQLALKAAGIATNVVGSGVFTSWGNQFEDNDYDVPSPSTSVMWDWNGGKTWAQWQALGHDTTGSVS